MNSNVQELLDKKEISYEDKGDDFLVSCFNPDHEDAHPSLRIDSGTGMFHCFSCGIKGDVFAHFGEYQSKTYDLYYEISSMIDTINIQTRGLEIPESAVPFEQDFRDISINTYRKFNAFTHTDPQFLNRVVFPIPDVSGKIQAFIGRYTHSTASPKYRVEPPGAVIPVYPVPTADTAILVEGIFDVLKLHEHGITNATALFGTHNLTYKNAEEKLAPLLASGVTRIVLLLDTDGAGKLSAAKLTDLIERKTECKVYNASHFLPDDKDPGDLDAEEAGYLAILIRKLVAKQL